MNTRQAILTVNVKKTNVIALHVKILGIMSITHTNYRGICKHGISGNNNSAG